VSGGSCEVLDREDVFYMDSSWSVNIFAKENGIFVPVWRLARDRAKVVQDRVDCLSFLGGGLATDNEIICKQQRVNLGAVRA